MKYFQNTTEIVDTLEAGPSTRNDLIKRTFVADGEHLTANIVIFGDSGNALHTQKDHDELLVIISGSVEFRVGEEVQTVDPGDLVFIPRDTLHGPVLKEGQSITVLSIFAPRFDPSKTNIIWDRDE